MHTLYIDRAMSPIFILINRRVCIVGMWQLVTRQSSMAKDSDEVAIFSDCILIIVYCTIYHSFSRYIVILVLQVEIQNSLLLTKVTGQKFCVSKPIFRAETNH